MRPLVMGILNVTPDSFSDGGMYLRREDALKHAERMVDEGADIIDVGGESSRPGATPVMLQEEIDRVIPVIEEIRRRTGVRISVDTTKPEVAEAALSAGATLINDISGGVDIRMADLAKRDGIEIILMHMRGTPVTMQIQPFYPRGVATEVRDFLEERVRAFAEAGVAREKIWLDPGIGFGKTVNHNLELLCKVEKFKSEGGRVVVGVSRKSFLGQLLGGSHIEYEDRESGTVAANLWAFSRGANVFRVHNVADTKRALKVWEALTDVCKP